MERKHLLWVTSTLTLIVMFSVLVSLSLISTGVIGATNGSTTVEAYVWNTEPNVTNITIFPSAITLSPGNTTEVNCTAYVWDWNGYTDINVTNATFYHSSVTAASADDNNTHYSIHDPAGENCNCTQNGGTSENASCVCTFDIQYFAENGTWTCNITIRDFGGNATAREYRFNDSNKGTATIGSLVAIDVTNAIDYGNLSVTETSTEQEINLTNLGNIDINVSTRGYGGTKNRTNPDNSSLNCELGKMDLDRERYSLTSGTAWTVMTNITNTSTLIENYTLYQRTDETDYGSSRNQTYWLLKVPLTVGGYCNGTLEFFASDAGGN